MQHLPLQFYHSKYSTISSTPSLSSTLSFLRETACLTFAPHTHSTSLLPLTLYKTEFAQLKYNGA